MYFFNYYPSFGKLSTEEEEDQDAAEEEDQNSFDTYDGERKWVPESNLIPVSRYQQLLQYQNTTNESPQTEEKSTQCDLLLVIKEPMIQE